MNRSVVTRLLPLLFVALVLLIHWRLAVAPEGAITANRLLDTDSYARLMRVEQLWNGAGWYDGLLDRLGAPEGMPIHWTRPLDLLILAPALAAHVLGVPMAQAIWWSGMWICPFLHALACLAVVWGARALVTREVAWFAGLALLAQPSVAAYGGVGRADHHALILLLVAISLSAGLWAARDLGNRRLALLAGLSGGAGVWVGPEAQLVMVPILAGFGLLWVLAGRDSPAIARQGLHAAAGFAIATLVGVAVDVPPDAWLATAYDRISILHVVTAVVLAGVFAAALAGGGRPGAAGMRRRLLIGIALSLVAVTVLALAFPGFQRSALATDDPVIQAFVSQVREMQPIRFWKAGGVGDLLVTVGGLLLALPFLPLALWAAPDDASRRVAVVWSVTVVITFAAALAYLRFVVEFAVPAAIGVAGLLAVTGAVLKNSRAIWRILVVFTVALLGTVGLPGIGLQLRSPQTPSACREADLAVFLRASPPVAARPGGPDPVVMLNNFNMTPRLAYETPFRFIAAPYHRGAAALRDTMDFFGAVDDAAARSILDRRQVAFVILCRTGLVPRLADKPAGNLEDRLLAARQVPDFMESFPLPANLGTSFVAYRVKN